MIFIGDIHGNFKKLLQLFNEGSFKDTTFIQVGDFGVGFRPIEKEIEYLTPVNDWLVENNNFLYAFRGNHDNPKYFEDCPFNFSNIRFLKDFSVIQVEGKNILTLGGAISIDRLTRKLNVSYWEDEQLPIIIPDIKDIVPEDIKIDIVSTHNCPSFVWPTEFNDVVRNFIKMDKNLEHELINERKRLDLLYSKILTHNKISPKLWVYGHMHKTITTQYEECIFQCCGIDYFFEHNIESL